jgi:hypothetical protein
LKKKKELKLQAGGTAVGYQNPLQYQVKTFQKEGEEDVRVPFVNNQAQFKIPEGFTERGTTTTDLTKTVPTTSTTQPVQQPPLTAGAPSTAKGILQQQGITSAKDILGQTFFEKSDAFLAMEGKTRAQSIIEQEQKSQEAQKAAQEARRASEEFARTQKLRAMQEEAELQKKENEFINNLDPKSLGFDYKPVYNTKFGEIDFSDMSLDAFINAAIIETKDKQRYIFYPEEYLYKGMYFPQTRGYYTTDVQVYNTAFLNEKHWDLFLEKAQYIDLSDTYLNEKSPRPDGKIDLNDPRGMGWGNWALREYDQSGATRGFLIKAEDQELLMPVAHRRTTVVDQNLAGGRILGLSSYNGQLVYVQENRGNSELTYFLPDGTSYRHWTERKKGALEWLPIIGKPLTQLATGVAEAFAQIPFGAEIAFALSGGTNPYLYASLKALEVAGKGGSLEDRFKAGAIAFATASAPVDVYGTKVAEYLQANKLVTNATLAKAAGGAIVGATVNGAIAAATKGDVKEAMAVGAVGGGLRLTTREVATKLVGGSENLTKLSQLSNIKETQLAGIITGSVASGAIASIKGQNFLTAFGNSLVAEGVGQLAASNLVKQLEGDFSKDTLKEIEQNTKNIISATARAAVRGEDLETALKAVTARSVVSTGGSILGKTIGELRAAKTS